MENPGEGKKNLLKKKLQSACRVGMCTYVSSGSYYKAMEYWIAFGYIISVCIF